MPFGEELLAGYGTRTTDQGYASNPQQDGQRKQFGSKDRDVETGLSYFLARYYSSIQGRFTSVDPGNAGSDLSDPQSLNGYAFARNNPLIYSDPSGMRYRICTPDGKECYEHSDDDFNAGRRRGKKDGYTFTGDGKYFEKGEIRDKDGNVIATYEQISLDDPAHQLAFEMQKQFYSLDLYKRVAANLVSSAILGSYKFNRQNWSRSRIKESIEKLRKGKDIEVGSVEEARELLDHMPDLRPATYDKKMPNPDKLMRDGFEDPRGTYRGDLVNKENPTAKVHPNEKREAHRENPHYNIKFADGTKAAIIIKAKK
jgi:RHS repeat-associated protein